jgi:putative addiction module killer protein
VLLRGSTSASSYSPKIVFYKEDDNSEPVKTWLEDMKKKKKVVEYQKVATRINRASQGNFGDHRMLGGAFGELKIDYGPGYRVYFGIERDELIVLLNGGSKDNQQSDIEVAKSRWDRYRNESAKENRDGK